jgi:hypothetical protein
MATYRVFFRGALGDKAATTLRRAGAAVYGGFVELRASNEKDARAKFAAATRTTSEARATAVRAA